MHPWNSAKTQSKYKVSVAIEAADREMMEDRRTIHIYNAFALYLLRLF